MRIAFILSFLLGITVVGDGRPAHAAGQIGEVAANFTLTGIDGTTYTLSDSRGKVVLLNFFGYN